MSETRRLLLQGIKRGLAMAGTEKGARGDEQERATQCVAMIASDLILAGQGRDVLAILAQATPKTDGGGGESESSLLAALRRFPGSAGVPAQSLPPPATPNQAGIAGENERATPDPQSVTVPPAAPGRPFFLPQYPLLTPEHEPRADDRGRPAGGGGDPHPPGSATPPPPSTVAPKILKNSGGAE